MNASVTALRDQSDSVRLEARPSDDRAVAPTHFSARYVIGCDAAALTQTQEASTQRRADARINSQVVADFNLNWQCPEGLSPSVATCATSRTTVTRHL
jgi:hypothetical protein